MAAITDAFRGTSPADRAFRKVYGFNRMSDEEKFNCFTFYYKGFKAGYGAAAQTPAKYMSIGKVNSDFKKAFWYVNLDSHDEVSYAHNSYSAFVNGYSAALASRN